jgi:hypothetical protein
MSSYSLRSSGTNSWIAVTMITDLFATSQRFNVPGASQRIELEPTACAYSPGVAAGCELVAKMKRVRQLLGIRSGFEPGFT